MPSMKRIWGLAVLAILGGCAASEPPSDVVWLAEPGAVYCYRTLADPDCYGAPVPGPSDG